ncbi:MAG: hypothetical protein DRR16_18870 [Candidatus Parabeggiatoa sp. nov. 3]|nr:MAG: hypothetical protein DRR00_22975 [Gammaproteobacteria bacterium]RKZ63507.1 MAG: hypothetical protein DRQ99_16995 [Gammaproteobacteria bacterium]RKZ82804.1 MAG: hypothetical protein DRR16_18870 [Gammaproteobacteria bacterium]HEW98892.1 hypothetical protein [Beggiatoa sp.]
MNTLHLQKMTVQGFKSLDHFQVEFQPHLTVFIGGNGTGKSTVLQFLAFIQAFILGEPRRFFEDRIWLPDSIQSFLNHSHQIEAQLTFENTKGTQIQWAFVWHVQDNLNQTESLHYLNQNTHQTIFKFTRTASPSNRQLQIDDETVENLGLRLAGSLFSILDTQFIAHPKSHEIIESVRAWGRGIFSLELMNPVKMRRGAIGYSSHLGHQGEELGGFLASLSTAQKARIIKRLNQFYPSLKALYTPEKKAGWIDLQLAEHFPNSAPIHAEHISDGYLRLIALAAIPELDTISLILIDEIEDGIEPHILPELINTIRQEQKTQFIMTSHSPILVNHFEPPEIRFMSRTKTGTAISVGFHELEAIQQDLAYQGAGEIWLHTSNHTIEKWVNEAISRRE